MQDLCGCGSQDGDGHLKELLHTIAADYGLGDSERAMLERAAGIPAATGWEAEPEQHAVGEGKEAQHQHWPEPANLFDEILGWCIVAVTSMVILLPILYQVRYTGGDANVFTKLCSLSRPPCCEICSCSTLTCQATPSSPTCKLSAHTQV